MMKKFTSFSTVVFILMLSCTTFAVSVTYTYDSLNRVTSVDYGNGDIETYTYDAAGNRITMDVIVTADTDGDGISDGVDNCLQTPNPGQQDTDYDGYGNICDADLNNDGTVGFQDFNLFKAAWLSNSSSPNWNPDADFDSDGAVGFQDFNILKSRWLTSEPWE